MNKPTAAEYWAHLTYEQTLESGDKVSILDRADFLKAMEEHAQNKIDKLQAFKDYVHKRLDDAGIEKEPNGEHSKSGCRIGDRLDITLSQVDSYKSDLVKKIEEQIKKIEERLETIPHQMVQTRAGSEAMITEAKIIISIITKDQ